MFVTVVSSSPFLFLILSVWSTLFIPNHIGQFLKKTFVALFCYFDDMVGLKEIPLAPFLVLILVAKTIASHKMAVI